MTELVTAQASSIIPIPELSYYKAIGRSAAIVAAAVNIACAQRDRHPTCTDSTCSLHAATFASLHAGTFARTPCHA